MFQHEKMRKGWREKVRKWVSNPIISIDSLRGSQCDHIIVTPIDYQLRCILTRFPIHILVSFHQYIIVLSVIECDDIIIILHHVSSSSSSS
ncbi:hypothetical protein PFISCL1PPCAC_19563, partial [Pristionchus fissidentatus]